MNRNYFHIGNLNGYLGVILLILLAVSCIRVDTPPAMQITVLDQFNNPVGGAVVGIFVDQEEWGMLQNPVQAWKNTNDEGHVLFTGLFEQNYYIYAEKDGENNLKNEIVTDIPLMMNQKRVITIHID